MCVCVHIYVCLYVHMLFVCLYVCMYVCMYAWTCIYIYTHIMILFRFIQVCTYVCMYVCMHACMYMYAFYPSLRSVYIYNRQAFIKILVENWAKIKHLEALNTPQEVMVASEKYIKESDPVLMFMNNYYIYNTDAAEEKKVKSSAIYTKFLNYTGTLKKDFSQTRFGRKLTALGIKPDDRNEYRLNIDMKPDKDDE